MFLPLSCTIGRKLETFELYIKLHQVLSNQEKRDSMLIQTLKQCTIHIAIQVGDKNFKNIVSEHSIGYYGYFAMRN